MSVRHLQAEFEDARAASAAVRKLLAAGVPAGAIEVYSRRPAEIALPRPTRASRMSLVAVATAVFTGVSATLLMHRAQLEYPLVTGGMPITSGWATGVVTFEATMAGAVLGILGAMLWEGRLLRRAKAAPRPALPATGVLVQWLALKDSDTSELAGVGIATEDADHPDDHTGDH